MRRLLTILSLLGFVAAIIIFIVMGDYGLYNVFKLQRRKASLKQHIISLEKEQKELKENIKKLRTDPEYIEKVVRNRYRMAEKGEKVFRVIRKHQQDST